MTECSVETVALVAVVVKQHCWDCSQTMENLEVEVQRQP